MMQIAKSLPVGPRFSAAAETYDQCAGVQRTVASHLTRFINGADIPTRILEIGCGTGILTESIARIFPNAYVEAIDIADGLVSVAQQRFANNQQILCHTADILALPTSQPFDMIVSSSSLHWIRPLDTLFSSIARLISSDGKLFFSVMMHGTLRELHESRARVIPHKQALTDLPNRSALLNAISKAGLHVLRQEREAITDDHPSANSLLNGLHAIGVTGGPVSSMGTPLLRKEITRLLRDYEQHYSNGNNGVYATYEVMYAACGVQPH